MFYGEDALQIFIHDSTLCNLLSCLPLKFSEAFFCFSWSLRQQKTTANN